MRRMTLLLGCVFVLGLFSCKTSVEEAPTNDEDVYILVNGSETMTSLESGQQYNLRLSNSSSATWAVNNAGLATLSASSGVSVSLTAKTEGSVTVTATANDKTYTCALQIIKKSSEPSGGNPSGGETNAPNVSFSNLSAYKVVVCRDGLSAEIATIEAGGTKSVYVSPGSNEITFHFRYSYCIIDDDDNGTIWIDAEDNGAYTYPVDSADIAQGTVQIHIPAPKNPQFNTAYLKVENQSTQPVSLYNGNTQQKLYNQEKYYIQPGHSGVYNIPADTSFEGFTLGASPSSATAFASFYVVSGALYQCVFFEDSSAITVTEENWLRESFVVTFETNGGSAISSLTTSLLETTLIPPTTLEGYYFGGWYADSELQRAATFPYIMTADITLYAKWLENTNTPYTVRHFLQDTDRSSYMLKDTDPLTGATTAVTIAAAKNYIGFTAKSFAQETISADGSTVVNIYYDRNAYTVTFNANGGTGTTTKQRFFYGIAQQLNNNLFTHSDFTFIGWAVSATDNPVYNNQAEMLIDGDAPSDITLYAAWFFTVTDSNVEDIDLTNIQTDVYTIKLKGYTTQNTLATLASKIKNSTAVSINLDMTEATGITAITADDNATSLFADCPLNSVALPEMLETIGDNAFASSGITSVRIPASIKTIGECAFSDCSKLETVEIGGAETIGYRAFANCTSMTSATLKSVGFIGTEAFFCCSKLESVKIDKVNTIGDNAFASSGIISVNIPASVKTIGEYAFSDCSKLESVEISGAETIGRYAFANCTSMTSVNIKQIGVISDNVFYGANLSALTIEVVGIIESHAFPSSLQSIVIKSVKSIKDSAFADCTNLSSVCIESADDISITADTFKNCKYLASLTLKSVGSIGDKAFYQFSNLSSVTIESVGTIGKSAFSYCKKLESVKIDGLETIGDSVFAYCTNLSSVIIESADNISITADTFNSCNNLASLTLKSVGSIGDEAFDFGFSNLLSITIESVGTIGESAFSHCTKLESVKIDGLETIGNSAFAYCTNLSSVIIESADDISITASTFKYCNNLASLTLKSVGTIGKSAFSYCKKLESIKIDGVGTIGDSAFAHCTNLSSVIIESADNISITVDIFKNCDSIASLSLKSVGSIGDKAFYQFSNLSSVNIESVGTIGESAFKYCTKLESVKIDGLETIGDSAFAHCTNLSSIVIESVKSIGDDAFWDCSKLLSASIDVSSSTGTGVFMDCAMLSSVTINAENIGASMFCRCSSLTTITIGNRVSEISHTVYTSAFSGCIRLTSVQFEDTENWYYVDSHNRIYIDVTDASSNATKLKSATSTWYKG